MIETVLLGLLDRWGYGGELLIIGLNRPQNFWVYLLFNGLGCSPDGIFDRNRRTRSMSNDTDAIYAEQRHATVLLIIGLFPNRLECTFGEPCAELSNRIPEELEFEPGQYRVGDCFSGFEDHVDGEPGFGSVAVIMVTAMFVFSAAMVRTGAAEMIGGRLFRACAGDELLLQIAVLALATL